MPDNSDALWAFTFARGDSILGIDYTRRVATEQDTSLCATRNGHGYVEEMLVYSIHIELSSSRNEVPIETHFEVDRHPEVLVEQTIFSLSVTSKNRAKLGGIHATRPFAIPLHLGEADTFCAKAILSGDAAMERQMTRRMDSPCCIFHLSHVRCWLSGVRRRQRTPSLYRMHSPVRSPNTHPMDKV